LPYQGTTVLGDNRGAFSVYDEVNLEFFAPFRPPRDNSKKVLLTEIIF